MVNFRIKKKSFLISLLYFSSNSRLINFNFFFFFPFIKFTTDVLSLDYDE
jgi:hypothetical protein